MGRFSVTLEDEKERLHRLSAFEASKMHHPSQSIQVVLVTTMGLARGEHAGVVHRVVTLEELAKLCGLTPDGVYYHTKRLREKGVLIREGGRKEGSWKSDELGGDK